MLLVGENLPTMSNFTAAKPKVKACGLIRRRWNMSSSAAGFLEVAREVSHRTQGALCLAPKVKEEVSSEPPKPS